MATIEVAKRLVKRGYLTNLITPKGKGLTMLLSGPHGIGKTEIIHQAAKELGGFSVIVEGGSLKEGEITGLPFASPTASGATEVRFVPHYTTSNIMKVEKTIWDKLHKEGLLDGKLIINDKGIVYKGKTSKEDKIFPFKSDMQALIEGEANAYEFGGDLPSDIKIELIESGEIKPVIFFVDELNRTEPQTMKELMNIVLNKNINGYNLPWWVSIVGAVNPSSQNSTYATNEMDDAQKDRFLKIVVDAKITDWVDYALEKGINTDVINAIAVDESQFMIKDTSHEDQDDQTPSPRSWELVAYIYDSFNVFKNTPLLSRADRKEEDTDMQKMIIGKVGQTAGRVFIRNLKDTSTLIKASDILDGKSSTISKEVRAKFEKQGALRRKITSDTVIYHIAETIVDFEKKGKSADLKIAKEYVNYKDQLTEFTKMLDDSTRITFVKGLSNVGKVIAKDGKNVFSKVHKCFAKDVLAQLMEFDSTLRNLMEE